MKKLTALSLMIVEVFSIAPSDACAGRPSVAPRWLWGSGSSVVAGLFVAVLALVVWLLGRQPSAAPQLLLAPAMAAGLPPTTLARESVDLSYLPPELVVPPLLPAGLQDTVLVEAWVRLYNLTKPIQLWGGQSITGQALAQSLLDRAIPVVWDVANVCRVGSCSQIYCRDGRCVYADAAPGVDPIYMHPALRGNRAAVVGLLAHEIFHRTQPFGPVGDTRFEEYWATFIQAQVFPASQLRFDEYDPLVPSQLVAWIKANALNVYLAFEAYPAGVTPRWDPNLKAGANPAATPPRDAQAVSAGDPFAAVPPEARAIP